MLAQRLGGLGPHEEALASYDEATRLAPAAADVWENRGCALDELGRHEETLAAYDRALALSPQPRSSASRSLSRLDFPGSTSPGSRFSATSRERRITVGSNPCYDAN